MASFLETEYEYQQAKAEHGWDDSGEREECYHQGFTCGYAATTTLPNTLPVAAGHEAHYWAGWGAGRVHWFRRGVKAGGGYRTALVYVTLKADDLESDPLKLALRILANYGEVTTVFQ